MFRRLLALLVVAALLAVGCSSDESADERDDIEIEAPEIQILPPGQQPGDPEVPQQAQENPDDGRLVVQSAESQLSTMLPDGTEAEVLTDDPAFVNVQPSWAPDGSRVAWVRVDTTTGQAAIAADRFDRSDFREVAVDESPFYLYWDPSASKIAHLSPSRGGIDLGIAEPFLEDGATTRRIDRGAPYFMAWGPDGDELLVHASGFRFDRIDLGSATIIVDEFPGSFGAPVWLADNSVFYVDVEDDQHYLVSSGPSGEGRRPLVTFDGHLRFTISNDGNRIAMQVVPRTDEEGEIVTASTGPGAEIELLPVAMQDPEPTPDPSAPPATPTPGFDTSLDAIDELTPNTPYMMGTFGGDPFVLTFNPALALLPSPDGQVIAWLEQSQLNADVFSWHFDLNGNETVTPDFTISETFARDYLPFFDQYAASHDFWSPSSNLFVYAGAPVGSDEPVGIWVMNMDTGETTRITDGVFAAFTRTPTAGGAASAL